MTLSEEKSRAELSAFIESYWCFESDGTDNLVFFPDGTFNIFFASEQFVLQNDSTIHAPGVYMVPLFSHPVSIFSKSNIYGIRFKAFSLHNIFAKNISQLGMVNNMETLYAEDKALLNFRKLFKGKKDPEEIILLLETVGFELLNKNFRVNANLRDKVNYILDLKGQVRVSDMADEFNLSRQGLHKYFKQNLLITPKELSAIWQLNHFFTLSVGSEDSLTEKALDAGYYDQAHFIHSFKRKYGVSPSQFMRSNSRLFVYAKENMARRFNNYYDPEV